MPYSHAFWYYFLHTLHWLSCVKHVFLLVNDNFNAISMHNCSIRYENILVSNNMGSQILDFTSVKDMPIQIIFH